MQTFDYAILGQPSLDIDVDFDGAALRHFGGAVVYGAFAAGALGMEVAAVPKGLWKEDPMEAIFEGAKARLFPIESPTRTSISNVYLDADRESAAAPPFPAFGPTPWRNCPPSAPGFGTWPG